MHITMDRPAKSLTSLMIVAAVHLALLAGLIFGLKTVSITLPHDKHVDIVPIPPEPVNRTNPTVDNVPVNIITIPIPDIPPPPTYNPDTTTYAVPAPITDNPFLPEPVATATGTVDKPADVFHAAVVDAKSCDKPDYPANALRNGQTGVVTLELLVGPDGKVADAKIAKTSGHRELDQAAVAGLSLCKFKPATLNGQAQKSWAKLQYAWNLDN